MNFPRARFCSSLLAIVALTVLPPSKAALLVYEGFNYNTGTTLIGTAPNASTVGLDTASAYASTQTGVFTVVEGLSFGGLATSGNAVRITSGVGVASAKMNLETTSFSGTLWSSYLVNITTKGGTAGDGSALRISNTTANSSERYQSLADSRNNSGNVAANYGAGNVGTNATSGLINGTTYLMIARFTRVGSTLTTGAEGVATVWALTVDQFSSFVAAADGEAWLNSASVSTGANGVSAKAAHTLGSFSGNDFQTGRFAQLVSVNSNVTFDEVRFGSSLADVTPIPEPATAALLMGLVAVGSVCVRRRRRG